tara:strand:+ start:441 stop:995 length:555 start_codon:yes stop_codon:yes gene_type:complete
MATIPTIHASVGGALETIEARANDILVAVRMSRATAINISNVNNKNSGYVKNLNLIIKAFSKISDATNLYRAERGVTNFSLTAANVNGANINTITNQLATINGMMQTLATDITNLKNTSKSQDDASAGKFCDTLGAINTQLLYMTAAMDVQRSTSGSGLGIISFQEIFADSDGIKYLDDLPSYE